MDSKHEVLVVEDDKMLNKLMCHYVRLAGHAVHSALDGNSAVASAQEHHPTLVLLDLMLPDISGFEVCQQLKGDLRTQSATVLMVTALDDAESRTRGMECGATEYIVKPFHPDHLMESINKYTS